MKLSSRVLGAHVVGELSARTTSTVLQIGSDSFNRHALASVDCFSFIAARHLDAAIAKLGVQNTRDLFDNVPPSALVLPNVGAVSLSVLGAAFEQKKLGGDQPLESWVLKHRDPKASREIVTFDTMKAQERKREVGETKARRRRKQEKHARRNEAQRRRVSRFHLRRERTSPS